MSVRISGSVLAVILFATALSGCRKPSPTVAAAVDKDDTGWTVQQFFPVPEGTRYESISCINRNTDSATCRVVGNSRNWTDKNYDSLYAYYLVNPENGIGTQISVHGASWMKDNAPVSSLRWVNSSTGWFARAGEFFKTTDGGKRWDWQQMGCPVSAGAVDFAGEGATGWAIGKTGVLANTRDGAKWTCRDISNITEHVLNSIDFVDTGFGWAVGEFGSIIHTETGGATWIPQISNTPEDLHTVHFSDRRHGWAVGAHGTIVHTNDGGENWALQTSQTAQPLFSISFADSALGWAVGANGAIVHTMDGGEHWMRQSSGTQRNLLGIDVVNGHLAYAVGEGSTLLKFNR